MRQRNGYINLLYLLNFIFACIAGLVSVSVATFIFNVLLLAIGTVGTTLMFKETERRQTGLKLFLVFFLVYGIFMMVTNAIYVQDPFRDTFYAKDSITFFTYIDRAASMRSIEEITKFYSTDFFSSDWKGFAWLSSIIGYAAKAIDNNNIILQKLQIVFCTSFTLVILFSMLSSYIRKDYSEKLTVVYACFSYNFFFSAIYLRDVHIGLLFGLYFLLILNRKGFAGILLALMLTVMIYFVRPEHGYFSAALLLLYVYLLVTDAKYPTLNKLKIPILVLLGLCALTQVVVLQEGFNTIQSTSENYLDSSMSNAGLGSFGNMLLKLPFGVRHVAVGLFSQTLPFPFYAVLEDQPFFFPWSIAALFWFVIWGVIIYSLVFKPQNPLFQVKEWRFLFLVAVLLILGASSNADTRRIMAVYPVVYVIFAGAFLSRSLGERKRLVIGCLLGYSVLILTYSLIK
ncbi:hypothetical protein J2T02_001763 [Chitinophaga terrae (ex Kim and Jung 2007)]|jgi:hypothetical protein|uniref:hypothetical protein n=1 Tax=Chitinophaga terrae (ex Kim and Jung 2007) TaxID=408074 RepID=UPI00277F49AF|nr:hypothetical protein [Chitinophaga terrae (ex Kim and Jung 2007)]MDQ0106652.1 hypothetical protein [Chitinophaga terrae (ex Kim and Jung 2007)]